MNFDFIGRACRLAAIGATLVISASCISVNERLGENLIPTQQQWDVFPQEDAPLKKIRLQMADSLSGYSSSRFTFGAISDDIIGTTVKGTTFTLVPVSDTLDFGKNTEIRGFRFTAARDTLSAAFDYQERIIQNVYVYELKEALDSTVLYAGEFISEEKRNKYIDFSKRITDGVPVYDGSDSLTFEFSREFAESMLERLKTADLDSMSIYLNGDKEKNIKGIPGIYITTDNPTGKGGRFNLFELNIDYDSQNGYITGNYAELRIRADYGSRTGVDTSFVFMFGPGDFLKNMEDNSEISQFAFNTSIHDSHSIYEKDGIEAAKDIYVEGGCGVKPVVKASEIREIIEEQMMQENIADIKEVVINKATIILPYNVGGDYGLLDRYPTILSPTVKLRSSDNKYVTYAGLTDSSISTENQGDINRSLCMYSPDISHHVQEIMKVKKDENYEKNIAKYDIWFLIMHEEVTEQNNSSSMNDYYQNLMYNSYYNNMMYDPYGYGYGYGGYGGYGYGSYGGYGGYGYNNYYNYYMMAAYANSYNSTTEESSIELDKDRYYRCTLNGPEYSSDIKELPRLRVTFSSPKTAEK